MLQGFTFLNKPQLNFFINNKLTTKLFQESRFLHRNL